MTNLDSEWVDETFTALIEADASLDQVVTDLVPVGIVVAPWQRHVLVRWLDSFETNTSIPLASRLVTLREWLLSG